MSNPSPITACEEPNYFSKGQIASLKRVPEIPIGPANHPVGGSVLVLFKLLCHVVRTSLPRVFLATANRPIPESSRPPEVLYQPWTAPSCASASETCPEHRLIQKIHHALQVVRSRPRGRISYRGSISQCQWQQRHISLRRHISGQLDELLQSRKCRCFAGAILLVGSRRHVGGDAGLLALHWRFSVQRCSRPGYHIPSRVTR